jgi:hypothetical protein
MCQNNKCLLVSKLGPRELSKTYLTRYYTTSYTVNCSQEETIMNICRVGHIALKSASPQVRKFFFLVPQRKLRSSKAQLRSLRFKILSATFMTGFGMVLLNYVGSYSVVVKSSAWKTEGLNSNLMKLKICLSMK